MTQSSRDGSVFRMPFPPIVSLPLLSFSSGKFYRTLANERRP